MQFGAMNFPIIPVEREIEAFARLGFDYLELAMDPPMAHHSTLSANRAAIVKALRDNGLGLVCHLPTFVSTADLTESIRQASITEMHRSMEVAADLGARKIVLHPSMARGMGSLVLDTVHAYAMDFLSEMVGLSETLDLTLCLENMFPFNGIGVELDDFEKWLRRFPGLMLTLDTGHANIDDRRGRRLKGFLDRFGQRIGHFHLSDNRGKRDEHLAVGQGTVKFSVLVEGIKALGYDDTLTLEVFDADRRMLVRSRERIEAMLTNS